MVLAGLAHIGAGLRSQIDQGADTGGQSGDRAGLGVSETSITYGNQHLAVLARARAGSTPVPAPTSDRLAFGGFTARVGAKVTRLGDTVREQAGPEVSLTRSSALNSKSISYGTPDVIHFSVAFSTNRRSQPERDAG